MSARSGVFLQLSEKQCRSGDDDSYVMCCVVMLTDTSRRTHWRPRARHEIQVRRASGARGSSVPSALATAATSRPPFPQRVSGWIRLPAFVACARLADARPCSIWNRPRASSVSLQARRAPPEPRATRGMLRPRSSRAPPRRRCAPASISCLRPAVCPSVRRLRWL
jgi:hypothetical protein